MPLAVHGRRPGHRPGPGGSSPGRRPRSPRGACRQRRGGDPGRGRVARCARRAGSWPARRPGPWPPPAPASVENLPEVLGGTGGSADRARHLRAGALRPAGGRRRRAPPPASRRGSPSAAAPPDIRTVDPGRPGDRSRMRRATRIGAMSWAWSPVRRRSQATTSALPSRACHGQTPRPTGRRRPTARSARPAATSASSGSRSSGSNEPSPSMKATWSWVAASSPAWTAAPYPGVGSVTTRAPSEPGDLGGAVGGSVVDDHHRELGRHSRQQIRQSRGLVATRQHQVTGRHGLKVGTPMRPDAENSYDPVTSVGCPSCRAATRPIGRSPRWAGLGVTLPLIAVAIGLPMVTGWDTATRRDDHSQLPPLHGYWSPGWGRGTAPALGDRRADLVARRRVVPAAAVAPPAAGVVRRGPGLAARARVRRRAVRHRPVARQSVRVPPHRPGGRRRRRRCSTASWTGSRTTPRTTG